MFQFIRWKRQTMIVLVAVVICAAAWWIHAEHRRLADDRGQFFTHEEMVQNLAFQKKVALGLAQEAESKAAENGADRLRWVEDAASLRARAAAIARSEADYRWRAELKARLARGGW